MVEITNKERGTVNTGAPSTDLPRARANRDKQLPSLPQAELTGSKTQNLRIAALNLGLIQVELEKIYVELESGKIFLASRDRSLDEWALPSYRGATGQRLLNPLLNLATERVFGSDVNVNNRFQRYDNYFNTVIPELRKSAFAQGVKTLLSQVIALGGLRREIGDPKFSDWMHQAAQQIMWSSTGCRESEKKRITSEMLMAYSGVLPKGPDSHLPDMGMEKTTKRCLVAAAKAFIESNNFENPPPNFSFVFPVPAATRKKYEELLQILLSHQRIIDILAAYEQSAAEGTKLAQQLVREAEMATGEFSTTLIKNPNHIWRYPILIAAGVKELRLANTPGFQEFALAIAPVISKRDPEKVVSYLGWGLLVIGLFSFGIGALIVTALDLALGIAGSLLVYFRDDERESAAKSSTFLPDEKKFAASYGYGDTALAAAFTFIAAMSLVRPTAKLVKSALAKKPPIKNAPPAQPTRSTTVPKEGEAVAPGQITQKSRGTTPETVAEENKALNKEAANEPGRDLQGKQESNKAAGGARKTAKRSPPVDTGTGPDNEVPDVPLRPDKRKVLQDELDALKAKNAERSNLNSKISKKIQALLQQQRRAKARGLTDEFERLEAEIEKLKDQYERGSIVERELPDGSKVYKNPDADRILEINDLLRNGTERQYYKDLTSAASRQDAFRAVRDGKLDPIFKPFQVEKAVEHVFPRIKIWQKLGFEKLKWAHQVFIFAWKKNLKLVSAKFNGLRGTTPYESLKRDVWGDFIKEETGVAELSRLEKEVEADVEAMIKNPQLIDAMMENSELLNAVSKNPRFRDALINNPGLINTVRKNPGAVDNIAKNLGLVLTE